MLAWPLKGTDILVCLETRSFLHGGDFFKNPFDNSSAQKQNTKKRRKHDLFKVGPKLCGSDIWTWGSGLGWVWGSVVEEMWSKIKMVRMVYRNISYRLDFKFYDPKTELWRKTENLRRSKNSKFSFEVQYWSLEGVFKDKMQLKIIIIYSAIILAWFPIKFIWFSIKYLIFSSDLKDNEAERFISLALNKYCSVGATIRPDTIVNHSFEIIRD